MLSILYEDNHIIVVIKPDGLESQSGKSFAPDMVSEIRKHLASHPQDIHKLTKETSTASKYPQPPYVGVIHICPIVIHRFSTDHSLIPFFYFSLLKAGTK